ncbi:DUF5906 domain-containing protein [Rhizobium sp. KDH_Rht_773_N]
MSVALPEKIERLAEAGFALQWLHPKSKRPIGNDWAAKPVASLSDLKRTYRDGNNVGVRLGKWSVVSGLYLHIIDFDIRVPSKVDEAREKLLELLPELDLDSCPTVISGSGGESRHFYILTDKPFPPKKFAHSDGFAMVWDESKQRDVKKWDWELHLLGTGAQAVIPPSVHPDTGQPYRWIREFDFDLLDMGVGPILPSEAVARIAEDREEVEANPERQQPLGLDEGEIIAVLDDLPADEWFEDRDQWMRVGMALHHETDGSDFGFETWCKYSKVSEKFDEKDQKRVWKSFRNRAQAPFRMASLVAVAREVRAERQLDSIDDDFDEIPEVDDSRTDMFDDLLGAGNGPEKPKKISKAELKLKKAEVEFELGRGAPPKIARMNRMHAVVRAAGRTMILHQFPGKPVSFGSVGDLHNYYENDRVPKDGTTEPVSKQWMRSKHRRSYPSGIVFAPNQNEEGAFNLWQGFSVEPDDSGSCALFLDHLLRVVCNGNEEHFDYALSWLAHLVQKPEEKPGVAFVVKGLKGAGKDVTAAYVGKMIEAHYITVWQKDQFFGKFNSHQASCLLLHVQEGFWAGDKRDEGSLKALITSEDAMIEPKGMNAFPVRSMLRIFISSNEKWVVPATEDERRFFVLNVSPKRRNDRGYFDALHSEMNSHGPAALLNLLLNRDISNFQVRAVPDTEALAEQKVEGLKNLDRHWFEILESGKIEGQGSRCDTWHEEPIEVEKTAFRDNYSRWLRNRRYDGIELSEVALSKRLKTLVPSLATRRSRSTDRTGHFFQFPTLDRCRDEFERYLGAEINWPNTAIDLVEDSRNTFNNDDLFN